MPMQSRLHIVLVAALLGATSIATGTDPARAATAHVTSAAVSRSAEAIAHWAARSRDNRGAPFLIVDKPNARLFIFAADGTRVADAPVLLGFARGDDSAADIGTRKLADIPSNERTTPAGRFVGEGGRNLRGENVVWVDYDAAVSMHRVLTTNPSERRLERLASPMLADKRISWGCINVPAAFFDAQVAPIFAGGRHAIIYVLPDTKPLRDVFPLAFAAAH
jgi:hypothetical protein